MTAEVFPPHTRTERGLPKPIIFMKIKLFTKRPVRHVSKGFALIATITLMMLLALLSVGLLTIASSQVRISEKQLFAAEAKSLARFSLEVALGQLQCELGPDSVFPPIPAFFLPEPAKETPLIFWVSGTAGILGSIRITPRA